MEATFGFTRNSAAKTIRSLDDNDGGAVVTLGTFVAMGGTTAIASDVWADAGIVDNIDGLT